MMQKTERTMARNLDNNCLGDEVFPSVVQLVAEHLHGEPLHDARPGHHQLLVQADPALSQRLKLSPQFSVANKYK